MGKIVISYWPIRGYSAPAIMMLEYGDVEYEFKKVTDGAKWFAEKFSMGFDFPNLPYLIDGDVKLTESWAIYKYIGRKLSLAPKTPEDERKSDMLHGVVTDIRNNFVQNCYSPDCYKNVDKLLERQTAKIKQLEEYLEGKEFLLDGGLSYVDFALWETFDHHRLFFAGIFDKFPNVKSYIDRFQGQEKISAFLKSDRFHQFPINGPAASWGGKDHNDRM